MPLEPTAYVSPFNAAMAGLGDGFGRFWDGWRAGWPAPFVLYALTIVAQQIPMGAGEGALSFLRPVVLSLLTLFVISWLHAATYVSLLAGEQPSLLSWRAGAKALAFASASTLMVLVAGGLALISFGPALLTLLGEVTQSIRDIVGPWQATGKIFGIDIEQAAEAVPFQEIGVPAIVPFILGGGLFAYLSTRLSLIQAVAVREVKATPIIDSLRVTHKQFWSLFGANICFFVGAVILLTILIIPALLVAFALSVSMNSAAQLLAGNIALSGVIISGLTMLAGYHRRLLAGLTAL